MLFKIDSKQDFASNVKHHQIKNHSRDWRKKFSVQMDGTQDTAMVEQETITLRYVLGLEVKERLFSVQKVYDASAAGIFELLKTNVEQQGLKMENIIGESFDGASNMRGEFGGVQKLIRDVSPNSVYTWCYAHVLNLAATDMVENITEVKNLIGLLQSTATFFHIRANELMFGAG
jgi:hypothetical protein